VLSQAPRKQPQRFDVLPQAFDQHERVAGISEPERAPARRDRAEQAKSSRQLVASTARASPILRLHSPLEPFFDKSWRPSEIEALT
jgi:hypothetical protein